jgi:hypothetical protein
VQALKKNSLEGQIPLRAEVGNTKGFSLFTFYPSLKGRSGGIVGDFSFPF